MAERHNRIVSYNGMGPATRVALNARTANIPSAFGCYGAALV